MRHFTSTREQLHKAERQLSFIEGGFTAIIAIAAIYFIAVFCGLPAMWPS